MDDICSEPGEEYAKNVEDDEHTPIARNYFSIMDKQATKIRKWRYAESLSHARIGELLEEEIDERVPCWQIRDWLKRREMTPVVSRRPQLPETSQTSQKQYEPCLHKHAEKIKSWRYDDELSYARIAELIKTEYGEDVKWYHVRNCMKRSPEAAIAPTSQLKRKKYNSNIEEHKAYVKNRGHLEDAECDASVSTTAEEFQEKYGEMMRRTPEYRGIEAWRLRSILLRRRARCVDSGKWLTRV